MSTFLPYLVIYDERGIHDARDGFHLWRFAHDEAHPEFAVENVRFDHDPEWRYRGLSIQGWHDVISDIFDVVQMTHHVVITMPLRLVENALIWHSLRAERRALEE